MPNQNTIKGCLIAGAIGDCIGSFYENKNIAVFQDLTATTWHWTDDTQLTLATCEALVKTKGKVVPEVIAQTFVAWFSQRKLIGLGASTLKALQELQVGQHWALAGRKGEFGAGNGAAMRIAPLAFINLPNYRQTISDVCRITHQHDEAYTGALAVWAALRYNSTTKDWDRTEFFETIINTLPDTQVRDKLIIFKDLPPQLTLQEVGKIYGASGYVVESIPLAIFAASKILTMGIENIWLALLECGADTDTNCAIAGQIMGSYLGLAGIPSYLLAYLAESKFYNELSMTMEEFVKIV
jgi:ADP-ribosyl-[dinitrogen reductase] hydrolase